MMLPNDCGDRWIYIPYHSFALNNCLGNGEQGSYGKTLNHEASFSEASYVVTTCWRVNRVAGLQSAIYSKPAPYVLLPDTIYKTVFVLAIESARA